MGEPRLSLSQLRQLDRARSRGADEDPLTHAVQEQRTAFIGMKDGPDPSVLLGSHAHGPATRPASTRASAAPSLTDMKAGEDDGRRHGRVRFAGPTGPIGPTWFPKQEEQSRARTSGPTSSATRLPPSSTPPDTSAASPMTPLAQRPRRSAPTSPSADMEIEDSPEAERMALEKDKLRLKRSRLLMGYFRFVIGVCLALTLMCSDIFFKLVPTPGMRKAMRCSTQSSTVVRYHCPRDEGRQMHVSSPTRCPAGGKADALHQLLARLLPEDHPFAADVAAALRTLTGNAALTAHSVKRGALQLLVERGTSLLNVAYKAKHADERHTRVYLGPDNWALANDAMSASAVLTA